MISLQGPEVCLSWGRTCYHLFMKNMGLMQALRSRISRLLEPEKQNYFCAKAHEGQGYYSDQTTQWVATETVHRAIITT